MKLWKLLALSFIIAPSSWAITHNELEESVYYKYQENILSSNKSAPHMPLVPMEQSLFVDALWDLAEDNEPKALKALAEINTNHYELAQRLRVGILQIQSKVRSTFSDELIDELSSHLLLPEPNIKVIYLISAYHELLIHAGLDNLVGLAAAFPEFSDVNGPEVRSEVDIARAAYDLFYHSPKIGEYLNGKYEGGVKLFMFCRNDRSYPCMFALRDRNDEIVRNPNGSIWTQRSLAQSARKLPSHIRNGVTPTGVWTIDSVMPYADQNISYGRFRRMIINFIPKSSNEKRLISLLPESSQDQSWWKQSTVARDVGRNLFRIHGTGKTNPDPTSTFYPFRQTVGCISQRENLHDGHDWTDQRKILDRIMVAQGNDPIYANETKIKGLFYFIELDDVKAPIEKSDLARYGIE